MHFEAEARRFEKVGFADVADHFFIVASSLAKEGVTKAARRLKDGRISGKPFFRQKRCFHSISRGIAGVERFEHRPLLAMDAAATRSSNSTGSLHLVGHQLEQAGAGDCSADAAKDWCAVKTAVMQVGTGSGNLGENFDAEDVGL